MDDHRMDAARYIMSGVFAEMGCAVDWTERTIRPAPERGKEMPRPVTIQFVLNGFEVTVGCQTLVFNDPARLLNELGLYLKDPALVEERFMKDALNSEIMFPEEERVELPRGTDGPEPVDCDAAGMPRPAEPPPVWEHVLARLDTADERLRNVERDLDRRVDHNSRRLDEVEGGVRAALDALHGDTVARQHFIQRLDRIERQPQRTEEGVVTRLNAQSARLDGLDGEATILSNMAKRLHQAGQTQASWNVITVQRIDAHEDRVEQLSDRITELDAQVTALCNIVNRPE